MKVIKKSTNTNIFIDTLFNKKKYNDKNVGT